MDAELEKLVESGKLTTKAAEQLEQLRPGSFCLHKSWGFGQVAEWNLLLNQIVGEMHADGTLTKFSNQWLKSDFTQKPS